MVVFYVFYLGGMYDELISEHMGHMFMNGFFLVSGCLFFWVIIGADETPKFETPRTKFFVLLGSMPFHILFGIMLINSQTILAESWYSDLNLPWIPDLLRDQQVGGAIALVAGEAILFVVLLTLGRRWHSSRGQTRQHAHRAKTHQSAEKALQQGPSTN